MVIYAEHNVSYKNINFNYNIHSSSLLNTLTVKQERLVEEHRPKVGGCVIGTHNSQFNVLCKYGGAPRL